MNVISVSSAQLRKAAELIVAAEPTVANGIRAERPAYLAAHPNRPGVLIVDIGILPNERHQVNRAGEELVVGE